MKDTIENRVTRLEYRVDGHDKDLSAVNSKTDALGKTLYAIEANLTQIKWVVVGAGAATAFHFLDLKDFIKIALSLVF